LMCIRVRIGRCCGWLWTESVLGRGGGEKRRINMIGKLGRGARGRGIGGLMCIQAGGGRRGVGSVGSARRVWDCIPGSCGRLLGRVTGYGLGEVYAFVVWGRWKIATMDCLGEGDAKRGYMVIITSHSEAQAYLASHPTPRSINPNPITSTTIVSPSDLAPWRLIKPLPSG
jgi:hypothetical protein